MTGLWVVLGVLAACTAFGLVQRARSGRVRPVGARQTAPAPVVAADAVPAGVSAAADLGADSGVVPSPATDDADLDAGLHDVLATLGEAPGERATLLQFSSAFCAPCRATRRILTEVAELVPGVRHVEVDAEQHLDLVRRLKIVKTPTTLVLDADGRVTARASGQPRKAEVLSALGHAVP